MGRKIALENLKPGMIFKIIDDMKYSADTYVKKTEPPKRVDKQFYLEEWHAVVEGPFPKANLYTLLFKQSKKDKGVEKSTLKAGEFVLNIMSKDIYDTEPPTEISLIEGKELRMIINQDGLRAKLVDKK